MRNSCKVLMLLFLIGFSLGSCTKEDNVINDEIFEVVANDSDDNQDVDPEPEPNN